MPSSPGARRALSRSWAGLGLAILAGIAARGGAVQAVSRPAPRSGGAAAPALRRPAGPAPRRALPAALPRALARPAGAVPTAPRRGGAALAAPAAPGDELAEAERLSRKALAPDLSGPEARELAAEGFERPDSGGESGPEAGPAPVLAEESAARAPGLEAGPRAAARRAAPPRPPEARPERGIKARAWTVASIALLVGLVAAAPWLGATGLVGQFWYLPVVAAAGLGVLTAALDLTVHEPRPRPDALVLRGLPAPGLAPRAGDAVALVAPGVRTASDSLMDVLAAAAAKAPAADAARELAGLFAQGGVPAPPRLRERLEGAWTEWGRRRVIRKAFEALAAGLSSEPAKREAVLRSAWRSLEPAVRGMLDAGPAEAARPPPDSPEGAWLAALSARVAAELPEAGAVDAALFKTKVLVHGMDRSVPILFWRDEAGRARLRVHRTLTRYLTSSVGVKRLSEMELSAEEMIPILARSVAEPYRSASRRRPETGRAASLDEAHAARWASDSEGRERQAEVLRSAAALGNPYVRFVRWQSYLGLPLLPATLWFLLQDNLAAGGLAALWLPPAGMLLLPVAVGAFAFFAWGGSRLYEKAVAAGWIPGSDRNVAYPVLLHMPWLILGLILPAMAFIEEAFFRQDLLPLFRDFGAAVWNWGALPSLGLAALASSLIFAAAHIPNYLMHRLSAKQVVGSALYFVIAGLILSVVYWFGGFLVAGVFHALYNGWILYRAKRRWRGRPASPDPAGIL